MCGGMMEYPSTNNTKILNPMQTKLTHTLADMKEITGISITAIQNYSINSYRKNMLNGARRMVAGEYL